MVCCFDFVCQHIVPIPDLKLTVMIGQNPLRLHCGLCQLPHRYTSRPAATSIKFYTSNNLPKNSQCWWVTDLYTKFPHCSIMVLQRCNFKIIRGFYVVILFSCACCIFWLFCYFTTDLVDNVSFMKVKRK